MPKLCSVPFCNNNISFERAFCSFHVNEMKRNKIKKFKELLPLWAVKNCKVHGFLKPSQCETHPAYQVKVCKQCRTLNRKPHILTEKIKIQFRKNNFKFKYGITIEEYNKLLKIQNFACAICRKKETRIHNGTLCQLAVDHCHNSKKVRGLLCNKCNRALGFFHDSIDLLNIAIEYLSIQF